MNNFELRLVRKEDANGHLYWSAFFPAVNDCVGGGETYEEAINEAYNNLEIYLDYLKENGFELPVADNNEYSGKFMLRVGKGLHQSIVEAAKREGISANAYICQSIAINLGKDNYKYNLDDKISQIRDMDERKFKLLYNIENDITDECHLLKINHK